jgi:hypothetical protein
MHPKQAEFVNSQAKRKVVRAGRRGGKTIGAAILSVKKFLEGARVLYAAPTEDQISSYWREVKRALENPIDAGIFIKNETKHSIELPGTEQRIRAKTAFNADTLRGDYADFLILDEHQMMHEDAWGLVGAPMLLDNNGDAVFIYTPPSLKSRQLSKAKDPRHASRLFNRAKKDETGRWAAFHFRSHDNPYISSEALTDITQDMTAVAYRMEIEAEDIDEAPGAIWRRSVLENSRKLSIDIETLERIVVGVDPTGSSDGDEAGIVVCGRVDDRLMVLGDHSLHGRPDQWAREAVRCYYDYKADHITVERNFGGDMVEYTIHTIDSNVPVVTVNSSRGKAVRAEPISAIYEKGKAHHIGSFVALEDEMCLWSPGDKSPNRMDALVFGATDLMLGFNRSRGDVGLS